MLRVGLTLSVIILGTANFCLSFICSGHSHCPSPCRLARNAFHNTFCDKCVCPMGTYHLLRQFRLSRCRTSRDCAGVSYVCSYGFCLCNNETIMVPDTKECVKIPTHGDKCLFGRYTFRCQGNFLGGLDPKCVLDKFAPNYGRCACKAEYVYDQQFDRCQLNPGSKYGSRCTRNETCNMAYSFCYKNRCICRKEFRKSSKSMCQSHRKYCPSIDGDFSTPGDDCRGVYMDNERKNVIDNCTKGQFCFFYADTENRRGGMVGHCCPIPSQKSQISRACPLTKVAPFVCPLTTKSVKSIDLEMQETPRCPIGTFECIEQPFRSDKACCPKPCANSDAFVIDGMCRQKKSVLDPCEYYPECPDNSICSPDLRNPVGPWVCNCQAGFVERNVFCGGYSACVKPCKMGGFDRDQRCLRCLCPYRVEMNESYKLNLCSSGRCQRQNEKCQLGYCACKRGHVFSPVFKHCVNVPRYGQNCFDEMNSVIYQCDESQYGVDYSCDLGSNRCSCKTAFTYNASFDSCIPDLGHYLYQDCSNDLDCIGLAYSTCRNGKCLCRQHYTENSKKLCEAETLTCPTLDHGVMKPSKSTCFMFIDQNQEFHNCGPQHFCLLHNGEYDEQGMPVGHCCPERKEIIDRIGPTCATSPPDNRTCNTESSPIRSELCPTDTHECVAQPYRRDKVCCPKPCRSGAVAINGYCYHSSELDKPCTFDLQCPGNSACAQSVICGGYSICPPACKLVISTIGICDRCDCPHGYFLRPDYLLVSCNATSQDICNQYNAHCKDGFCQCQKGYSMIPDAKTCIKTPKRYGDPCEHKGYALDCIGINLNKTCNLEPGTENFGRCICAQGFLFEQKVRSCVADSNLIGSKCIDNVDCSAAHSHCYHGECMCKHGFEPDQEGLCRAKSLFCPIPRKEAQTSSPCFVEHPGPNQPFRNIQGNCTTGEFCFLYHDHIDPDGNHIGHCCKRPGNEDSVRSTCAMSPSRGSCGDLGAKCISPDLYCMEQLYWKEPICCDKACNMESYKNIRGQCYSIKLHVNHPCQFDLQCPQDSDCMTTFCRDNCTVQTDKMKRYSASAGPDRICKCRQGFSAYRGKCQKKDD